MNFNYFALIKKSAFVLFAVVFSCSDSNLKLKTVNASDILKQVESHMDDKSVLVNFWATNCAPCIEEIPWILELSKQYSDDLKVYFVSTDWLENKKDVIRFLEKNNIDGISFLKEEGNDFNFINTINEQWSGAMPFTIIYDKNGNVSSYWENIEDKTFFESAVNKALAL
jgi:thiol-disulfide isomerase/thioredoxin